MSDDYSEIAADLWCELCEGDGQHSEALDKALIVKHLKRIRPSAASMGSRRIMAERTRQMTEEGWTSEHDDVHSSAELTAAACCYAALARRQADGTLRTSPDSIQAPAGWPWEIAWWKPSDNPIRNLERAGALLAAEIDRLLRLDAVLKERE